MTKDEIERLTQTKIEEPEDGVWILNLHFRIGVTRTRLNEIKPEDFIEELSRHLEDGVWELRKRMAENLGN